MAAAGTGGADSLPGNLNSDICLIVLGFETGGTARRDPPAHKPSRRTEAGAGDAVVRTEPVSQLDLLHLRDLQRRVSQSEATTAHTNFWDGLRGCEWVGRYQSARGRAMV